MQSQTLKLEDIFNNDKYTASKLTEWFILENLYNSNLLTDIRGIQYNKYALEKKQKLIPLTPMFCDNIMLFTIVGQEQTNRRNNVLMLQEDLCSIYNTLIRKVFKDNNIRVVGHSVKCKKVIAYSNKGGDKYAGKIRESIKKLAHLQEIIDNYKRIYNKSNLEGAHICTYKIELADEVIDNLLPRLETALKQLREGNNLFYILDFDITQDLYNNIDYKELKDYFLQTGNFRMEKDINEDNKNCRFVILDNTSSVGLDCLTYIDTQNNTS